MGFSPALFVSRGAAFSGGYTLLAQEAGSRSKALLVPWPSPRAAGYGDSSGSPAVGGGEGGAAPRPT